MDFLARDIESILKNTKPTKFPEVTVVNGNTIHASLEGIEPLEKELSNNTKKAYVSDNLQIGSLVSLGKLCDDSCIAIFITYNMCTLKKYNHHRWKEDKQRPVESPSTQ